MRHAVVWLEVDPDGVRDAGDGGGYLLSAAPPQTGAPALCHGQVVVAAVPGAVVGLHLEVGKSKVDGVT